MFISKWLPYCSACGGGADTLPLDLFNQKKWQNVESNRVIGYQVMVTFVNDQKCVHVALVSLNVVVEKGWMNERQD